MLTSPAPGPGPVLGTSNVSFRWSPGTSVTVYQLSLSATKPGASDLFLYKGSATSASVPSLPANGAAVYATLYSYINGVWQSNSYVYTESGATVPAVLQSPTPGLTSVLGNSNVSFHWSPGTSVNLYQLSLSATKPGGSDLFFYKGLATSANVPSLPANGATVYATLYSYINGVWQQNSYVYTESGTPLAVLTSPTPGLSTVLGTSNVIFQWTPGRGITVYQLNLSATTPGASDLFLYKGTATSATLPTLAAYGQTIYATLYCFINGAWQSNSYVYTETRGPESVTVAGTSQVRTGSTARFAATVANLANTSVTWQVNGVTGGNSAVGVISSAGIYTPPPDLPTTNPVIITAVSVELPSLSGSTALNILNPVPLLASAAAVLVSGTTYTLEANGSSFVSGAQITVSGMAQTTTFISATELQTTVTIPSGTPTLSVTVMNPDPGSTASNSASATIMLATIPTAARLLDQATFGPTLAQIQNVRQVGVDAWITGQFNTPDTPLANITLSPLPAACQTTNSATVCEESEWWQTALNGNDQLRQRVAFALSEMFVISSDNVSPTTITYYHNTLANDAFTNFSTILKDVTLSPGMGFYLNMLNSAKAPAGQIANENYARELVQLFALGLNLINQDGSQQLDGSGNPIPAYTEAQVQAFARALTGWTYATAAGGSPSVFPNNTANYFAPMAAVESAHDATAKALLNGTVLPAGQTAENDLQDALQNVLNHPNVGPFVCRQLIQHLVSGNPSPAYVSRIAAVFANDGSGIRGDMQAVIRAILEDPEARAGDDNPLYDGGHLREPILWLTNYLRAIGFTITDTNGSYYSLSDVIAGLHQLPYHAPNVFNFFSPSYLIPKTTLNAPEFNLENTSSAEWRLSIADVLMSNTVGGLTTDLSATSTLGQIAAASPAKLVDTLGVMFMHGQMPTDMRTQILATISGLNAAQQVRVAVYLVITSSQYKIMH